MVANNVNKVGLREHKHEECERLENERAFFLLLHVLLHEQVPATATLSTLHTRKGLMAFIDSSRTRGGM